MTEKKLIPAHLVGPIVELIEGRIRSKRWLYWPPGPMMGQVFDREACKADIEKLITIILDEKQ